MDSGITPAPILVRRPSTRPRRCPAEGEVSGAFLKNLRICTPDYAASIELGADRFRGAGFPLLESVGNVYLRLEPTEPPKSPLRNSPKGFKIKSICMDSRAGTVPLIYEQSIDTGGSKTYIGLMTTATHKLTEVASLDVEGRVVWLDAAHVLILSSDRFSNKWAVFDLEDKAIVAKGSVNESVTWIIRGGELFKWSSSSGGAIVFAKGANK